jgi:hypothetical protein
LRLAIEKSYAATLDLSIGLILDSQLQQRADYNGLEMHARILHLVSRFLQFRYSVGLYCFDFKVRRRKIKPPSTQLVPTPTANMNNSVSTIIQNSIGWEINLFVRKSFQVKFKVKIKVNPTKRGFDQSIK